MSGGVREGSRLEADNGLAFERKGPEMKSKLTRQFGILAIALVAATGMAACEGNVQNPTTSEMAQIAKTHHPRSPNGDCWSERPVVRHSSYWSMVVTCDTFFATSNGSAPAGRYLRTGTVYADWAGSSINWGTTTWNSGYHKRTS